MKRSPIAVPRRPVAALFGALHRFNARHPWSHNDVYAGFVLRQARGSGPVGSALDVGCGSGNLVRRLATRCVRVVGLEADEATADRARRRTADLPNVSIVEADLMTWPGPEFDVVSAVAVLHHLPLDEGLRRLRRATAAGGRLVIVGAYDETRADLGLSIASLVLNPLVGLVLHPRRALGPPEHLRSPTAEAASTMREVRAAMGRELPGARVRRGLFWRYTAVWAAPGWR